MPGMPGMSGAMPGPQPRVEHALVDLPSDAKKLADLFNKRQAEGWEFAGQVGEGGAGGYLKLAFKRPLPMRTGGAGGLGGMGMPGMPGMGGPGMPGMAVPGGMGPGVGVPGGTATGRPGPGGAPSAGGPVRGGGGGDGAEGGGPPPLSGQAELVVFKLKNADAVTTATVLGRFFHPGTVIEPESRTNSLLIRAGKKELDEIRALLAKLDEPGNDAPQPKK